MPKEQLKQFKFTPTFNVEGTLNSEHFSLISPKVRKDRTDGDFRLLFKEPKLEVTLARSNLDELIALLQSFRDENLTKIDSYGED